MKTIEVQTSRPYQILVGAEILGRTGEYCAEVKKPCRVAVIG